MILIIPIVIGFDGEENVKKNILTMIIKFSNILKKIMITNLIHFIIAVFYQMV
jgi:hypothetical protein